jgi:hypothetical protein
MGSQYTDFKDLLAYKKAYQKACEIFTITLTFPNSTLLKKTLTTKNIIEENKRPNHPDSNRDHKRTQ